MRASGGNPRELHFVDESKLFDVTHFIDDDLMAEINARGTEGLHADMLVQLQLIRTMKALTEELRAMRER